MPARLCRDRDDDEHERQPGCRRGFAVTAAAEHVRLRRDITWNLVPVVLLAGVGLALNFLIAAWWDEAALGVFSLVTIALFDFAVIGASGIQYSALRAVAEAPDDRERVAVVVVGALVPNAALAALSTALYLALHRPIGALLDSDAVATGMLWSAPALFCFSINKVMLGVVNGLRRMRAFAIYTSLRYLMLLAGVIIARWQELDAAQLPVIWSIAEGVLLLALVGELAANVELARGLGGWLEWARRHVGYGLRSVTATLAFEVNSKLDVWMLGTAYPEAAVGIYSLAAALSEGATQLSTVLQNNINPLVARHLAAGERAEVEALVRRLRRWFVPAMAALCALGAVLYPLVIPWLIGKPAFAEGAAPFAIMMTGVALASPYLPFMQTLLMGLRPGWHTVYMLGIVAVNLICNLLLIPVLGPVGAAISLAASLVAGAVLLRVLVRFRLEVRI
jgi:O-antigen/teichoic acid export membrane protein